MPVSKDAVHVEHLAQFRKALGAVDPALPKNLRAKLVPIGKRIAERARQRMPVRSGRAARSVSSGVSGNRAYVSIGKASAPYAPWLDFGGTLRPTGGRRNTIVRSKVQGGRYLYPAIEAMRPETEKAASQAFTEAAREAGLI
jgi:hypothetical protein